MRMSASVKGSSSPSRLTQVGFEARTSPTNALTASASSGDEF
jgi:hypothetical protein